VLTAWLTRSFPSSTRRIPGVEGLRALAATAVVVTHVWGAAWVAGAQPVAIHGRIGTVFANLQLGVTLFFCLSGFLLYAPFVAWLLGDRPAPRLGAFARNRLLRIWPAFLVCCAAAMVGLGLYRLANGGVGRPPDLEHAVRLFTMTTDVTPSMQGQGFPVAWTLPVELIFYASLPVLSAVAVRLRWLTRWQAVLVPPVVLLALGLATRTALQNGPLHGSDWYWVIEASFPGQCDMFAWGMLVAIVAAGVRDHGLTLPARWRLVAVPAGVVVLAYCMHRMKLDGPLTSNRWNSVAAAAIGVLLAAIVLPHRSARPWVLRVLEWRPLVFVGLVSYSVYLWHSPVLDFTREHGWGHAGTAGLIGNVVMVLGLTIAVATLSYVLVEVPALRRKRSMRQTVAAEEQRQPATKAEREPEQVLPGPVGRAPAS
jgi:peptidoglycan/LPS O-acetylase OafA/YrhL